VTRTVTIAAIVVALAVGAVGWVRGTWAVGGSDSSCYGLMARAFADGALQPTSPLATSAPWPSAQLTTAPGGFVPSPVRADGASPVCAPGYALLAAPFVAVAGADGLFLVSPLAGMVLVWVVFLIGRRFSGDTAGLCAALLTATSPVVLYQIVQPMNDVAAAALWTASAAALVVPAMPRPWLAGGLLGAALLVRPNLVPAGGALVLTTAVWLGPRAALSFGAAAIPFGLGVLALNDALYGGPFQSGYGRTEQLFALSNVPLNAARHLRAVVETQAGLPLVGLIAPWFVAPARRSRGLVLSTLAVAIIACYLPYRSFPEWSYLRFLLPAVVALTVLASAGLTALASRAVRPTLAHTALIVAALALSAYQWTVAVERHALDLSRLEGRFRLAAEVVRDRLPGTTVALTVWNSGSVRFHADREVVLWDSLDPAWLDRAIAWLDSQGRSPAVAIESFEEPAFRARFAGQDFGALDWPPRFDVDSRIRIFVTADRARYLAGEPVPTDTVWGRR
jgi:hypothetical protein